MSNNGEKQESPFRKPAPPTPEAPFDWSDAPKVLASNILAQLLDDEKHHTERLVPEWWKRHVEYRFINPERVTTPSFLRPIMTLIWVSAVWYSVIASIINYRDELMCPLSVFGLLAIFFVLLFSLVFNALRSDVDGRGDQWRAFLVVFPSPIAVWLALKELWRWMRTIEPAEPEAWDYATGAARLKALLKPLLDTHTDAVERLTKLTRRHGRQRSIRAKRTPRSPSARPTGTPKPRN